MLKIRQLEHRLTMLEALVNENELDIQDLMIDNAMIKSKLFPVEEKAEPKKRGRKPKTEVKEEEKVKKTKTTKK